MMTFFCILNIDECAKECLTQRVVSKWFEEVYAFKCISYNLILFKYRLLNGPYNNIFTCFFCLFSIKPLKISRIFLIRDNNIR